MYFEGLELTYRIGKTFFYDNGYNVALNLTYYPLYSTFNLTIPTLNCRHAIKNWELHACSNTLHFINVLNKYLPLD